MAAKSNELSALTKLLERLGVNDGLKGAPATLDTTSTRVMAASRNGTSLSPASSTGSGELRLPAIASIVRVKSRAELAERCRFETRYYISSAPLTAKSGRQGGARPLGHREPSRMGARCRLQRRTVKAPQRSLLNQHGHRQTLCHQSHAIRKRQSQHRAKEHQLPRPTPQSITPLTSIRCPGRALAPQAPRLGRERCNQAPFALRRVAGIARRIALISAPGGFGP